MTTELMLDVGQANELKLAFRKHGWTNIDIKKLCEGNILTHILPLVREFGETKTPTVEAQQPQHTINCDTSPFTPEGWKVEYHKQDGQFVFDPTKVKLHLSPNQQNGKVIGGNQLRRELENEPVLNANVLDYLLAHPELIPEEWKGKYIFFWGTIYRHSSGNLCVRCLFFRGGGWGWDRSWLVSDWYDVSPAALRASI